MKKINRTLWSPFTNERRHIGRHIPFSLFCFFCYFLAICKKARAAEKAKTSGIKNMASNMAASDFRLDRIPINGIQDVPVDLFTSRNTIRLIFKAKFLCFKKINKLWCDSWRRKSELKSRGVRLVAPQSPFWKDKMFFGNSVKCLFTSFFGQNNRFSWLKRGFQRNRLFI